MPTPRSSFAAVAATLGAIDPTDDAAVENYYRAEFVRYPEPVRFLIADFLVGATEVPSAEELELLKQAVGRPTEDIPSPAFPDWDERYGPAMDYLPADTKVASAGE
jgi:hypothetical protein